MCQWITSCIWCWGAFITQLSNLHHKGFDKSFSLEIRKFSFEFGKLCRLIVVVKWGQRGRYGPQFQLHTRSTPIFLFENSSPFVFPFRFSQERGKPKIEIVTNSNFNVMSSYLTPTPTTWKGLISLWTNIRKLIFDFLNSDNCKMSNVISTEQNAMYKATKSM